MWNSNPCKHNAMITRRLLIVLIFAAVMNCSQKTAAGEQDSVSKTISQEELTALGISKEDWEVIKELEMLENIDILEDSDVDFLNDYESIESDEGEGEEHD